jgi:hypothetical protein
LAASETAETASGAAEPAPIDAPVATRRENGESGLPGGASPARTDAGATAIDGGPGANSSEATESLVEAPALPLEPGEASDTPQAEQPTFADAPAGGSPASAATLEASPDEGSSGDGARVAGRPGGSSSGGGSVGDIVGRAAQGDPASGLVGVAPAVGPSRVAVRRDSDGDSSLPEIYSARVAPDRPSVVRDSGGDGDTEGAVQAALVWLAASQSANGQWDASRFGAGRGPSVRASANDPATAGMTKEQIQAFQRSGTDADTGVTGLALLAFLGAGNTHRDGPYQETVLRGIEFLLSIQGTDGSLGGGAAQFAFMYCHGMATCALSEAYGMSGDEQLAAPLRKALAYTLGAQQVGTGGWRYKKGDNQGDTSQLGWQLMALKSAELAGIDIPSRTRQGIQTFLASVSSGTHGGLASYRPRERVTRTMTAEALVCRQFLGISRSNPACDEAGDYLMGELPGQGRMNLYYWYYGTLATYHLQGDHWEKWNIALKEALVNSQRLDGNDAGSWDPDPVWGGHGGRVFSTALAALCLEVYYRYLPLYAGPSLLDARP